MRNVFRVVFFLAFVNFWSCNTGPDLVVFPASKKANLTEFTIAEVLAWPDNLLIHGDNIILYDAHTEWVFKIFSRDGFEHKGNLLQRGRGPAEEVNVAPFSRGYGKDRFLFQGTNSMKIADILLSDNDLNLVVSNEYAIPKAMHNDYDIFLLNDKLCSANTFLPTTRDFRCSGLYADSIFEWGEYLPLQRPISLAPHEVFFIGKFTAVHPEGSLLAIVYQNFPLIRIYCSKSGQMLHQLHVADGSNNEKYFERNDFGEGFITYYCSIRSTAEYIYALYRGADMSSLEDLSSVLHIWKWDGTPIMNLEFNRAIYSFDITPDNKKLIASSVIDVDRLFVAEIPWD